MKQQLPAKLQIPKPKLQKSSKLQEPISDARIKTFGWGFLQTLLLGIELDSKAV
jgi:hypothetical protein